MGRACVAALLAHAAGASLLGDDDERELVDQRFVPRIEIGHLLQHADLVKLVAGRVHGRNRSAASIDAAAVIVVLRLLVLADLRKITMQLRTSAIRVAAAVDLIDFSDWRTAGVGR